MENGSEENASASVETNWDEIVYSFDDMDLKEDLLRGISTHFDKPSPIQQVCLLSHPCNFSLESSEANSEWS
jgi:translation initiation factor 4A